MLAVTNDGAWIVQTPQLPFKANGSGDVTAALFSAQLRGSGDAASALGRTAASVFELLAVSYTHLDVYKRQSLCKQGYCES